MTFGLVSSYTYKLNKSNVWTSEKRNEVYNIILNESQTNSSSWTSNGVNVEDFSQAFLIANITEFSTVNGDERLVLEIETSYNNSDWVHCATFIDEENAGDNVIVTGDPDRGKIKQTGTYFASPQYFLNYMRIKGTLNGSNPSVTLEVTGHFYP